MQIIIDIPKYVYDTIIACDGYVSDCDNKKVGNAIKNGVPLPKEHRRLIILSEDAVKREQTFLDFSRQKWISEVGLSNATVAILETDKSEREK